MERPRAPNINSRSRSLIASVNRPDVGPAPITRGLRTIGSELRARAGSVETAASRAHLTTHRRSHPSARVASTTRRPRIGAAIAPSGRRVHARRHARGSNRRAKPRRIGPYRAQHHSPATLPDTAYLQVFSGSTPPRTPCFTRERSQVRNPPRPSLQKPRHGAVRDSRASPRVAADGAYGNSLETSRRSPARRLCPSAARSVARPSDW
jgi:hypothetical protein